MRRKFATAAVVATLALAAAHPALAGFRIQEADPEFPEDVTTSWFQGGKARVEGAVEGLVVIIDVKAGEGWIVDQANKRYAGGKVKDLAEELKKIEQLQPGDPAPEETDTAGQGKSRVVEVKAMGPGGKMLGYDTQRYQVLVDKELLEELWMAPKLDVPREIDLAEFNVAMQKMLGADSGLTQGYETSEPYRGLRASGYPLRQVLYFVGEKSTIAATAVAVQEFPVSDFAVPKGFTKMGYAQLLLGEEE